MAGRGGLAWLRVFGFTSSDVSRRGLWRARAYADEPDVFTETTVEQYADLANNLAYGVIALRTREERRRAESEVRQLNASLEKRVDERTIELVRSNEQLRRAEEQLRQHGERGGDSPRCPAGTGTLRQIGFWKSD